MPPAWPGTFGCPPPPRGPCPSRQVLGRDVFSKPAAQIPLPRPTAQRPLPGRGCPEPGAGSCAKELAHPPPPSAGAHCPALTRGWGRGRGGGSPAAWFRVRKAFSCRADALSPSLTLHGPALLAKGSSVLAPRCARAPPPPWLTCGPCPGCPSALGVSSLPPPSTLPARPAGPSPSVSVPGGPQTRSLTRRSLVALSWSVLGSRVLRLGPCVFSVPVARGQEEHTVGAQYALRGLQLAVGKDCCSASSTVCWAFEGLGHLHSPGARRGEGHCPHGGRGLSRCSEQKGAGPGLCTVGGGGSLACSSLFGLQVGELAGQAGTCGDPDRAGLGAEPQGHPSRGPRLPPGPVQGGGACWLASLWSPCSRGGAWEVSQVDDDLCPPAASAPLVSLLLGLML